MASLKFYDLGKKKSFTTSNYTLRDKGGRHFAVATAPSGRTSWRIMKK